MTRRLLWIAGFIAVCLLVGTVFRDIRAEAGDERSQTDPTAWWWYHGKTANEVSQLLADNQGRLVRLEVEQASPSYLFSVAMVANSGAYAKAWWWYYGVTASQLSGYLSTNNARLIDLEAYEVSPGDLRFAAVMVANTGTDAKAWWWYYNVNTSDISTYLSQNNARLVGLETYFLNGQRLYAAIMISNTGSDARAWWWYVNRAPSEISALLGSNNARLIDIAPYDVSTGTFNVVMEACPCDHWWWYYGVSESTVNDLVAQNGARLIDIETYYVGRQKTFAVIMLNNSNAITTRVGDILRNGTNGTKGLYLKQVGGPVLANLQESTVFEPASSIKVLLHLYAMRRVQSGLAQLTDSVVRYSGTATSCPSGASAIGTEALSTALNQMMWNSDNTRTRAISDTFGVTNINNAASSTYGMANTRVNHVIGCGGPIPNTMTLVDAGVLYEGVANGTFLSGTYRDTFYSLMAGRNYDFTGIWQDFQTIIDQEVPASVSASQKQTFTDQVLLSYKAGGYTISGLDYISVAGWTQIPFCQNLNVVPRQYVFGVYISGATHGAATDNTWASAKTEVLREQIRAALSNWSACYPTPTATATRTSVAVPTSTPQNQATATALALTPTATATATATQTSVTAPTSTPGNSATATALALTPSATQTSVTAPTSTPGNSATATALALTPTATAVGTRTPVPPTPTTVVSSQQVYLPLILRRVAPE